MDIQHDDNCEDECDNVCCEEKIMLWRCLWIVRIMSELFVLLSGLCREHVFRGKRVSIIFYAILITYKIFRTL